MHQGPDETECRHRGVAHVGVCRILEGALRLLVVVIYSVLGFWFEDHWWQTTPSTTSHVGRMSKNVDGGYAEFIKGTSQRDSNRKAPKQSHTHAKTTTHPQPKARQAKNNNPQEKQSNKRNTKTQPGAGTNKNQLHRTGAEPIHLAPDTTQNPTHEYPRLPEPFLAKLSARELEDLGLNTTEMLPDKSTT
ncbi:hypothetical protein Q3G72_002245 [Acer saccharum]|nr:hypothetical protein Q3G72_002245 [Acer saccharum]